MRKASGWSVTSRISLISVHPTNYCHRHRFLFTKAWVTRATWTRDNRQRLALFREKEEEFWNAYDNSPPALATAPSKTHRYDWNLPKPRIEQVQFLNELFMK